MFRKLTRRGKIRLWAYTLAAITVLSGFVATGYGMALKYRTLLEYDYERSLNQLSEHLNNIEITLMKGTYSGTAAGAADFAMNLWSEAGAAKTCLSALPTYENELDGTYKFLSQVGEYSLSLAKKLSLNKTITVEERAHLQTLSTHAKNLSLQVSELCARMNEGGLWRDRVERLLGEYNEEDVDPLDEGLTEMEEGFSDYPTLLYDGPFSDHIEKENPMLLVGKGDIGNEEALKIASMVSGLDVSALERVEDTKGKMPCYNFQGNGVTISITQKGGYCSYLLDSREVSQNHTLKFEDCKKKALEYLNKLNLGTFKESYYSINEGVCTINFAYQQEDITCYTDLVKVGVAMDNGNIVSFNAQGYIMNHYERNITSPKYTESDAKKVLSPLLSVVESNKAIIPLNTIDEQLCYEFLCTAEDDRQVLVYINANTLQEEDIKILIKDDGGVLTI